MSFDFQPRLAGHGLSLRPLSENDRAGLTEAAADPAIWAGHPARNRYEPRVFAGYFDLLLASGRALSIAEKSGRIIGTSSYYVARDGRDALAIGFTFLTRDHWGGGANFSLKRLMLGHIFAARDQAWFHIDPTNIRSQTATERLGAKFIEEAELDLGTGPARWMCYRLHRADWQALVAARG